MSAYVRDNASVFQENAAKVSTRVVEAATLQEAAEYALGLCGGDRPGLLALSALPPPVAAHVRTLAARRGVGIAEDGLRDCAASLAVGFSLGDLGIADSASVVMAAAGEDSRLASMLSEIHVVALPKSGIVADLYEAEASLSALLAETGQVSFISGCSRTSDIERVLTLGVHGPLELHVVLVDSEEGA